MIATLETPAQNESDGDVDSDHDGESPEIISSVFSQNWNFSQVLIIEVGGEKDSRCCLPSEIGHLPTTVKTSQPTAGRMTLSISQHALAAEIPATHSACDPRCILVALFLGQIVHGAISCSSTDKSSCTC